MFKDQWPLGRRFISLALALCLAACVSSQPASRFPYAQPAAVGDVADLAAAPTRIRVVSFNIKFLGHYRARANAQLADMLADYDLVLVQELVAPPYAGRYPDGSPFTPDPEAAAFFDEMRARGFSYVVSPEDTGASQTTRHDNGPATEWFVAFYRRERVQPAPDLPVGFLAANRYHHPDFQRVPYAFGFRAGSEDLVFISVHLAAGDGSADMALRRRELGAIFAWIGTQRGRERDFIVVGDMNLRDCAELWSVTPPGYGSLNASCQATNVSPNRPKPYDHAIISLADTRSEIPGDVTVVDLVAEMRGGWSGTGAYPGAPFVQGLFERIYSDHRPIAFDIVVDGRDDDPSRR